MNYSNDTNILVYEYDMRQRAKSDACDAIVQQLQSQPHTRMPLQVLGELCSILPRRLTMAPGDVESIASIYLSLFATFAYSKEDIRTAIVLAGDGVFSFWDALLVTSCERNGCTHLVSEDMQDGFKIGDLEIITPFADDGTPNPRLMSLLAA